VTQRELFDRGKWWDNYWTGMPEFSQPDATPLQTVRVHFRTDADREEYSRLVQQPLTRRTKYIWYPQRSRDVLLNKRYRSVETAHPKYPVYVISKGRWTSNLTSRALETMGVVHRVVIEPQEYDQYAAELNPDILQVLPFSDLGRGSIPARNWVWEDALRRDSGRHWILDDNISGFVRLHNNTKISVADGAIFRAAEQFTDRYENVALSGFHYRFFAVANAPRPPFIRNSRIYSTILIDNALDVRWRGRYNEDTDLALRVLKAGMCTVLFNAFLANKQSTMTMKGGNTDELYAGDGRLKMAEELMAAHPDVTTVVRRFGRWQHHVDYSGFRNNEFIKRPDAADETNCEMELVNLLDEAERKG
jgi:hypothetical protein